LRLHIWLFFVTVFLAFTLLAVGALALNLTLQPGSEGIDSEIRNNTPDTNYGSGASIFVGMTASEELRRGLLWFNLSSIPPGALIFNTTLRFYATFSSNSTTNITIRAYSVLNTWNESSVTWNNRTSESWTARGGDFNSSALSSVNVTNLGYYEIGLTAISRPWLVNNSGLMLKTDELAPNFYIIVASSDYATAANRPWLNVNYSLNEPPNITGFNDSSQFVRADTGGQLTFSINWSDDQATSAHIYVCNETANISGCPDLTYCTVNTSSRSAGCSYTVNSSDNQSTHYFIAVCDDYNCSLAENTFYVNHAPNVTVIQPNGGEIVNQSLGNYTVLFNISDSDGDNLTVSIYYSSSPGTKEHFVDSMPNQSCTECSYSWNTTNIGGWYYLDIEVNDGGLTAIDSSNSSFRIASITDFDAPSIYNLSITSDLVSGASATIRAVVNDSSSISKAWCTVNAGGVFTNHTMSGFMSGFNVTIEAGAVGTYYFKVSANDSFGNFNATEWQGFQVAKPNASISYINASNATRFGITNFIVHLNASSEIKRAYLYAYSDLAFIFVGHSQNRSLGNVSGISNYSWYAVVPPILGERNISVMLGDSYGNTWVSDNYSFTITEPQGGSAFGIDSYQLYIDGYKEVVIGENYLVRAYITNYSGYINPNNINVTLRDPIGNLLTGLTLTQQSTGIYNLSYTTGPGLTQGQWETIIQANISNQTLSKSQFWKLIGGPFDVRSFTVDDNIVNNLAVSFVIENTGYQSQDITLVWNLTMTDGTQLHSGAETTSVGAVSEKPYTVHPITSYVGDVRLTVIGYYSGGERAGGYVEFATEQAEEPTPTPPAPTPTGGGGAGPSAAPNVTKPAEERVVSIGVLSYSDHIIAAQSMLTRGYITLYNKGSAAVRARVSLTLDNYAVWPEEVSIPPNEAASLSFNITAPELAGNYSFKYIIFADGEKVLEKGALLEVLPPKPYLLMRIEMQKSTLEYLRNLVGMQPGLADLNIVLDIIERKIKRAEELIGSGKDELAEEVVDSNEAYINDALDAIASFKIASLQMPKAVPVIPYITITTIIVLITAFILLVLLLLTLRRRKKEGSRGEEEVTRRRIIRRSPQIRQISEARIQPPQMVDIPDLNSPDFEARMKQTLKDIEAIRSRLKKRRER